MYWIQSGIENPSKSEVIGRCGGDEKNRMTTQNRQKSNAKKNLKKPIVLLFVFIDITRIMLELSCIYTNLVNALILDT